ncbi:MAG: hypothetical protein ACW99Q_21230, partial [Candidatus Kariarchaeaceae archaeon]
SAAGDVDNNGLQDFLISATTRMFSSIDLENTIGKAYLYLSTFKSEKTPTTDSGIVLISITSLLILSVLTTRTKRKKK